MSVKLDSVIDKRERVSNSERKFGSAKEYYPCKVILEDGTETVAMFTENEMHWAIDRANKNPEDVPTGSTSLWGMIFGK